MALLIPDMYKLVCTALGCSDASTVAQIEAEIALSLQADKRKIVIMLTVVWFGLL